MAPRFARAIAESKEFPSQFHSFTVNRGEGGFFSI